jgi:hypothetical protein
VLIEVDKQQLILPIVDEEVIEVAPIALFMDLGIVQKDLKLSQHMRVS